MAKEEFGLDIIKSNNSSSFEEIFNARIESYINSSDCLKCIHAPVCARHMGGMNLMKCEYYKENLVAFWKTREDKNDYLWVECSNCGFRAENYIATNVGISSTDVVGYKWKACPKCGANMIFKEENNDKT